MPPDCRPRRLRESPLVRRMVQESRLSVDQLLVGAMREVAKDRELPSWTVVEEADAGGRGTEDWGNLLRLANEAAKRVEGAILERQRPVLLVHPGLLARYDNMGLLETLRDEVGRKDRCPGAWVLVAADEQFEHPRIDNVEIPLISPGQALRVPEEWIRNRHRGAENDEAVHAVREA